VCFHLPKSRMPPPVRTMLDCGANWSIFFLSRCNRLRGRRQTRFFPICALPFWYPLKPLSPHCPNFLSSFSRIRSAFVHSEFPTSPFDLLKGEGFRFLAPLLSIPPNQTFRSIRYTPVIRCGSDPFLISPRDPFLVRSPTPNTPAGVGVLFSWCPRCAEPIPIDCICFLRADALPAQRLFFVLTLKCGTVLRAPVPPFVEDFWCPPH